MGRTIPFVWMSFGVSLVAVASEGPSLVTRGYELLPNARWLEELERDGRAKIPRTVLEADVTSVSSPMATSTVDLSQPDFGLDFDFRKLNGLMWNVDSLAGGFRREPDPTSRFWFDEKHRRVKTTWWWIGLVMSFIPTEKDSDYFSR